MFQSSGWPSVVTLVGNWFGKKRLGLIFGIWNSHTSVGNILGALVAGVWVNDKWGYSFIVPGVIIGAMGILSYLFVIVRPEDVGLNPPDHVGDGVMPGAPPIEPVPGDYGRVVEHSSSSVSVTKSSPETSASEDKPITLLRAIRIPGVIEFSVCLFFAKAVSYTFLLWLPRFIQETSNVENDVAADLSAMFDAGMNVFRLFWRHKIHFIKVIVTFYGNWVMNMSKTPLNLPRIKTTLKNLDLQWFFFRAYTSMSRKE